MDKRLQQLRKKLLNDFPFYSKAALKIRTKEGDEEIRHTFGRGWLRRNDETREQAIDIMIHAPDHIKRSVSSIET